MHPFFIKNLVDRGKTMKKLSWILIIVGIAIMLTPLAGGLITRYFENKLMTEWEDGVDHASTAMVTTEEAISTLTEAFDEEKQEDPRPSDVKRDKSKQKVLGIIKINKIKVNLPIVEGVESHNLKAGIGHIPGTAGLGQKGNCALAGHRSYTFGRFFNRLDELEAGDKVVVMTKEREYTYSIYEKIIVLPEDVYVLKSKGDESTVTLITCTPVRKATHRLIIYGRLISSK